MNNNTDKLRDSHDYGCELPSRESFSG